MGMAALKSPTLHCAATCSQVSVHFALGQPSLLAASATHPSCIWQRTSLHTSYGPHAS